MGLFSNEKAFGETYNITGDYETTWTNIIKIIAEKYGVEANIVDITNVVQNKWKCIGIKTDEIFGDKGRGMLFDNSKIKLAVPCFSGDTCFDFAVNETIDYYENNQSARVINYSWDARIDRLISFEVQNPKKLNLSAYKSIPEEKDKILYILNRYFAFIFIQKLLLLCVKFMKIVYNKVRKKN